LNNDDDEAMTKPNDLEGSEKALRTDDDHQTASATQSPTATPSVSTSKSHTIQSTVTSAEHVPDALSVENAEDDELRGLGPEDEQTQFELVGPITADHPDVQQAVKLAVEEAQNAAVTIPADVYVDMMKKAIQTIEQEQREKNPDGQMYVQLVSCR
jgi:hypothetical protein